MKKCSRCAEVKPLDDFTKSKHRPDGLNVYCRVCTRAASKRYGDANPEAARARGAAWYAANKERRRAKAAAWWGENPGKAAEYCARWREANPGANAASSRKWYAANREAALLADKMQRHKNLEKFLARERASYAKRAARRAETAREWRSKNKDRIAFHAAKRRSDLAKRTPIWLTAQHLAEMVYFFTEAARLTRETGAQHHVDHVVPLRGRTVSGLNVPWNLQVLPAIDNLKKSNRHAA